MLKGKRLFQSNPPRPLPDKQPKHSGQTETGTSETANQDSETPTKETINRTKDTDNQKKIITEVP